MNHKWKEIFLRDHSENITGVGGFQGEQIIAIHRREDAQILATLWGWGGGEDFAK